MIEELLFSITETTRERLGAAACSVAVLDGAELEFRVASGVGSAEVLGMRIPVGRGIAGWVVASGQAIAVADVQRDPRFAREEAAATGYVPRTILAVPVEGEDGPFGVLEVLDRSPGPQDMTIAGAAARQVALVLAQAEAFTQLSGVLADPGLAGLIGLVRDLDPADRALATRLLAAVAEHRDR